MSYSGYANYETWCLSLWIANDEGLLNYWQEQKGSKALAAELRDWVEDNMPEVSGFFADLLTHAVGMVDWHELAEAVRA